MFTVEKAKTKKIIESKDSSPPIITKLPVIRDADSSAPQRKITASISVNGGLSRPRFHPTADMGERSIRRKRMDPRENPKESSIADRGTVRRVRNSFIPAPIMMERGRIKPIKYSSLFSGNSNFAGQDCEFTGSSFEGGRDQTAQNITIIID